MKNKYVKCTACMVMLSIIIISVIDLVAYLNGGVTSTEYITLSQTNTGNFIGYFTVNDTYWGIDGDFGEVKMISATNPNDTEFRFIKTNSFLKDNMCIVYYLPISKFIIKIEIPITGGDSKIRNFVFYEYDS